MHSFYRHFYLKWQCNARNDAVNDASKFPKIITQLIKWNLNLKKEFSHKTWSNQIPDKMNPVLLPVALNPMSYKLTGKEWFNSQRTHGLIDA